MKDYAIIFLAILLLGLLAAETNARPTSRFDKQTQTCRIFESGKLEWESRPWGLGGKTFEQSCKSCHSKNNSNNAPFLWEESKTSKAWNRVFAERYPACAKNGKWDNLTENQLQSLNDYLFRFSYDSRDLTDNC